MKNLIRVAGISALVFFGLTITKEVAAQTCVTPVITSISNTSPVCEGGSFTLSATGTVGGVSSSFVRMAAIGGNAGNRAFDQVFSSGDRAGSIARISNAQFDAIFTSQTSNAARAAALKNVYDILMFTWASPNDNNITWGLITAYLNLGGSVFFDGDYANIDNLYDGTSNSVIGSGFDGSYGCGYTIVAPAPFPSLVANGINGCFANHHTRVTAWPSWMEVYIKGGTNNLAIAGIYPSGNRGRLIVQGPDQDYHAYRGAGGTAGNQYQIILNQMDFLSANQAGFTWTGPNGFTSNEANPVISNATASMSGTYTARLTNISGGGCYTENTTTVTINTAAAFTTCPSNFTTSTDHGSCDAVVTYNPGLSGTPAPSVSYSFSGATSGSGSGDGSGATFGIGTTTVTLTATNICGSTTCVFTITVEDNEAPVIEGENTNLTVDFNAASGYPASYTEDGITFLSLYGNSSHVHLGDNNNDGSNDILNHSGCCSTPYRLTVGNNVSFTLVSMEVKSLSGNPTFYVYPTGASVSITSTGTYTFPSGFANVTEIRWSQPSGSMVIDNVVVSTKTTGSCPADISVANDADTCGAHVTYSASVTDNCSASLSFSPASGSFFSLGTTEVTVTATDASNNTSSCTFDVTVSDTQDPTIACAGNQAKNNDQGKCSYQAVGSEFDPSTDDNCSVASVTNNYNNAASLSGAVFNLGTTTVMWTVTDGSGNTSSCSFDVVVSDNENPVITCAASQTRSTDQGNCSYQTVGTEFDPSTSDNCSVATVTNDYNNGSSLSGAVFPLGTTTVVWTVTDGSGNSAACSMDVTVEDNENPSASCQNDTVTLSNGGASISTADINLNSSDNCGISAFSLDQTTFDCSHIGSNTVTLTVTDNSSNTSTCQATVTVVGVIPTCSITSSPNTGGTVIGGTTTYAATNQMFLGYGPQSMNISCSASGGPGFTYSWTGSGLSSTSIANPVFTPTAGGNYTLTCTVTNSYGCTVTCSITICVIDVTGSGGSAKNPKVIVCHIPAGNPNNPQTISISVNAVSAHLGYHGGCKLGTCGYTCNDNKSYKRELEADIHQIVVGHQEADLIIYPNPSVNSFNFILESPIDDGVNMTISDINGRILSQEKGLTPNDVVTFGESLHSGVYFVTITQGDFAKTVKVTKVLE